MEGQARSALLVARSARNQQVSPSKILLITLMPTRLKRKGRGLEKSLFKTDKPNSKRNPSAVDHVGRVVEL
jgi:hypothetical protein